MNNPVDALVAEIEGLLPKTLEQWTLSIADDGYPLLGTTGDIVCSPDMNHEAGDAWDLMNFSYIAAVQPANITSLLADRARLIEEAKSRTPASGEADLVAALRDAKEHILLLEACLDDPKVASPALITRIDAALTKEPTHAG